MPDDTHDRRRNGFAVSRNLTPRLVSVAGLSPLGHETRVHLPAQIRKLARSLEEWGFVLPIVIDTRGQVVDGWALVLAARKLRLPEIPAVTISDLSGPRLRALRLALNRLSEDSKWDPPALALEFGEILELDHEFDLSVTGFDMGEIDVLIDGDGGTGDDEADALPDVDLANPPTTEAGDLWLLGQHRVLCADATRPQSSTGSWTGIERK